MVIFHSYVSLPEGRNEKPLDSIMNSALYLPYVIREEYMFFLYIINADRDINNRGFDWQTLGRTAGQLVSWAVREWMSGLIPSPLQKKHQAVAPNVLNKGLKGGMGI